MSVEFEQMLAGLPGRAPEDLGLEAVRRKNELARMLEAHLSGDVVQLVRIGGEPPYDVNEYHVLLRSDYLAYTCIPNWIPDAAIVPLLLVGQLVPDKLARRSLLPVRVTIPSQHPDRACTPGVTLLDHSVMHPAALGSQLCWAEQYDPTLFIVDALREIAELLRFARPFDANHPLNPLAVQWVESGHEGFELPLGS